MIYANFTLVWKILIELICIDLLKNKDVILVGLPNNIPLVATLNDYSSVKFDTSTNQFDDCEDRYKAQHGEHKRPRKCWDAAERLRTARCLHIADCGQTKDTEQGDN